MTYLTPQPGTCTRLCRVPFALAPALILIVLTLLAGCVATPQTDNLLAQPQAIGASAKELDQVPFFPQERYQCGPASLATVLADTGVEITPEELVNRVYVPQRKGSFQLEMLAAARHYHRIPYLIRPELKVLIEEINAGNPVLVLQNLGVNWYPRWHYAVVVGFDMARGEFILRSGEMARRATPFKVFENTWRRSNYWGVVLLKPGELPTSAQEQAYFLAVSTYAERGTDRHTYEALTAGLERWPQSINLRMGLANHHYKQGQLTRAESIYRAVLEADPAYASAHNNLALVLFEQGKREEALLHASQAVALGGSFADQYRSTLAEIEEDNSHEKETSRHIEW